MEAQCVCVCVLGAWQGLIITEEGVYGVVGGRGGYQLFFFFGTAAAVIPPQSDTPALLTQLRCSTLEKGGWGLLMGWWACWVGLDQQSPARTVLTVFLCLEQKQLLCYLHLFLSMFHSFTFVLPVTWQLNICKTLLMLQYFLFLTITYFSWSFF